METCFIHSPKQEAPHCHSASLLFTSDGERRAVYYCYPNQETKNAFIAMAQTQNGEWRPAKVIQEASGSSLGNPIIIESPRNRFHLIYSSISGGYWDSARLRYCVAEGDGPFSSPKMLNTGEGILVRHPPIIAGGGHWLLPVYNEKTMTSQILRSKDDLSQWQLAHSFDEIGLIQGQILRVSSSSLVMVFRPMRDRNTIYLAQSKDNGRTWSKPKDTGLPCPKSGLSACSDGTKLFIIYNHTEKQQRYPLSIASSDGDFSEWSKPWHLDEVRFELSYPNFYYKDNKIHGVYTYNRRMIKEAIIPPEESQIQKSGLEHRSIGQFKDIHANKSVFIIASGTSIKDLDLSPLDRRMTIGLNRSFMKYANTYYHCMFDQRLFDLYEKELKDHRCLFTLMDRPWGVQLENLGAEGFSKDLSEGIYTGYTISYFALQLAVYMGFRKIFFLGLDLRNPAGQTHFFGFDHHSANHNQTEFPKMLASFQQVAPKLKAMGIEVYNCSPSSSLDCFPKISFEEAIKRS